MRHLSILLVLFAVKDISGAQNEGHADLFNIANATELKRVKSFFQMGKFAMNPLAYSRRSGRPSEGHSCDRVTSVPSNLRFITRYRHYRKYTHAYDIPIISSGAVPDAALKRACYVVRFLLADRRVLRRHLYKYFGRVGIVGAREGVTSIPEHRHLGRWWDDRARGLGGTLHIPISTGAEENILCYRQDKYRNEDIFLHEFSHGIQEIAIKGGGIPSYMGKLRSAYNNARRRGLWRSTYAMSTIQEYFAEGVQSFFDVNAYSSRPDGVHNHVNTRAKLRNYDPTLFRLLKIVFPCMNIYHKRCNKGTTSSFRMNCDGDGVPKTDAPRRTKPRPKPTTPAKTEPVTDIITEMPPIPETPAPVCENKYTYCSGVWRNHCLSRRYKAFMRKNCYKTCCCDATNRHRRCSVWAKAGYCTSNRGFMHRYCKKSCGCHTF